MTPPAQARPPAPADPADALQGLADRLPAGNPFAVNRVDRLSTPGVDVSGIHHAPYEKIIALAREACEQDRGIGAVLWGDAGSGKSHLLARLARWAEEEHHACFVYLHNLLPSPEQLPRYVPKYVVSFLTGGMAGPLDRTPLFRVINAAIREALRQDGLSSPTMVEAEASYNRFVNRLAARDPTRAVLLDRDVHRVLFLFFRSVYTSRRNAGDGLAPVAARWLSGDPIDPEDAGRLGIRAGPGAEDGVRLADDQQVKQALVALTQLALARRQPVLLCFDQVDNLGPDHMVALSRFLHDLLDSCGNLLIVFCGVQDRLVGFREQGLILKAAWDRLAQHKVELLPIDREQGRHILEARLESFLEPLVLLPGVKAQVGQDSLFPLGRGWYAERVGGLVDVQPRRVIDWGRERWEEQQARLAAEPLAEWLKTWERFGPPPPPLPRTQAVDALVGEKIGELVARRKQEPHTLPPGPENLSELVRTLLGQCLGRPAQYALAGVVQRASPKKTQRAPYDFEVRKAAGPGGAESGTGVLFVGTGSATSATGSLRRLLQATGPGQPESLLLVTEERLPLKVGAAGLGYLNDLSKPGKPPFTRLVLTFDQYAELDSLQAVVGLALSGDLEVDAGPGESRTVREDEVVASHHRGGRYLAHPLLRELLGENKATTEQETKQPLNDRARFYDACACGLFSAWSRMRK
jgi:hypothetical protein